MRLQILGAFLMAVCMLSPLGSQQAATPNPIISAQLTKALDAKHVKAGDLFEARLLDDLEYGPAGQRKVIPRNSKLVGHVTESEAWKKGRMSRLGLTFDSAVEKNGAVTKIDPVITGFRPPPALPVGPIRTIQNTDNAMARAAGPVSDPRDGYISDPVVNSVGTQTESIRIGQTRTDGWHAAPGSSRASKTAVLLSHAKNARLEKGALIYLQMIEPEKQ
ncbi:MAG TPA: hypothetical protein VFW31_05710 [Candidatus Angelobacter sp.]|nr:hypothetical protein [Candidatus Angelobacter sp.]